MERNISSPFKANPSRSMGPHVRQVIPSAHKPFEPFVFLDHFGPFDKYPESSGVPPHPHAGIATVTYLFEGSNRHQDSLGNDVVIQAGDIAWMHAGKGIIHAEGMNEGRTEKETVHGLQLWVSLPAKDKFSNPDFFHYPKETLPVIERNNCTIKVLCGELFGKISPVRSLTPTLLWEIKMPAGSKLELPIPENYDCGIYTISGIALCQNQALRPIHIAGLEQGGDSVRIEAGEDSHVILLGGLPLNEPIVAYASFVMNSEDQIRQVIRDYQEGRMGGL